VFVAKYDSSRKLLWARGMGGSSEDVVNAITVDGAGNVYTSGHFFETADFDPGAGSFTFTSLGSRDTFVSQLNSAGNFVWAGQMGGVYQESANDLAIDAQGNLDLTGYFKGTTDFDPGAGQALLSSTPDDTGSPTVDAFVAKLVPTAGLAVSGQSATFSDPAFPVAALDRFFTDMRAVAILLAERD
jgi:hypothetical protein